VARRIRWASPPARGQADVHHKSQARLDLLENLGGDDALLFVQLQSAEEPLGLSDAEPRQFADVLASDGHSDGLRPQTSPGAALARLLGEVSVEASLDVVACGVLPSARQVRNHSLKREPVFVLVVFRGSVHEDPLEILGNLFVGDGLVETDLAAESLHEAIVEDVHTLAALAPGVDGPVFERNGLVRHDQVRVEFEDGAQPVAASAGAVGTVEAEQPGRQLLETGLRMLRTGEFLTVNRLLPVAVASVALVGAGLLNQHEQNTVGELQGGLHGIGQPDVHTLLDDQPVHDRRDIVLAVLVQGRDVVNVVDAAVDANADEAFPLNVGEDLAVLAFLAANQRGADLYFGPFRPGYDRFDDLRGMLAGNLAAANPAVRLTHPGEKQPEIVVYLRRRGHRRTRVAAGAALLDGDRGRQARNVADGRFLHLFQELPRVRTERFDVLAPPLGVNRIERQRALARAADARNHDHLIARDAQADVLEIVLGGTGDLNCLFRVLGHMVCEPNASTPIPVGTEPHLRVRHHVSFRSAQTIYCNASRAKGKSPPGRICRKSLSGRDELARTTYRPVQVGPSLPQIDTLI